MTRWLSCPACDAGTYQGTVGDYVQPLGFLVDPDFDFVQNRPRPRPENFVCGDLFPILFKKKNNSSEVPTISLLAVTSDEGL